VKSNYFAALSDKSLEFIELLDLFHFQKLLTHYVFSLSEQALFFSPSLLYEIIKQITQLRVLLVFILRV